ncbi:MAG: hypothetical protein J7K40_09815 [candidate division Zixibacteria bacterium]|nr:hypothetical protein [candidate division Zixibacteria bacterium]
MKSIDRRKFIKDISKYVSGAFIGGYVFDSMLFRPQQAHASIMASVYVAKNGTPAENVAKVIDMRFGGIENIIGSEDIVVINPNGQWTNQGGSNCACCMGLIDLILNRPSGFSGEIIFTECTQFSSTGYWTATGNGLLRNGPYNFNDMIAYYHSQGHNNVNGVRLWRNTDDSSNWPVVTGPHEGQGWVREGCAYQCPPPSNRWYSITYPCIRSPYSNKIIDLKNGIYDNGYDNQPSLKFIKMPNLNNHGGNGQMDYAGITSALKSFLGITEIGGPPYLTLHDGYSHTAHEVGQAIGGWMNNCRKPDFFLTTAEWVGWGDRTSSLATQAKTVGFGEDPVTLDYYMSKYVLWPTHPESQHFNPDYNPESNNSRLTMDGCQSLGFGTTNESEIAAIVYDYNSPSTFRFDIDRKIKAFREGGADLQEVLDLISQYNSGE